ncbi:HipA N-terminal domain-containing protein [Arcicella aquatica]|uniref:HipA N-terminal domain-containing protein n=1 Tax=Arcicella aquatica TaxID=217141 RepID=A0ABU5QWA2_9BACT|nr:HipA N-terminal domain-containing protein [Arcicella aquatica]MEA5260944.1 HipA N-terminal domain-containing protein [Arcicella aquatica]
MRQLAVYRNGILAGILTEENREKYLFKYDDNYLLSIENQSISLTLPKSTQVYTSEILFPFFYNMLSEGVNKKLQSITLKIDENDHFGLLSKTSQYDTIGAITLKPLN